MDNGLPKPHGGKLVQRVVPEEGLMKALGTAKELPKIEVSRDTASDLENIALGVFSPLEGPLGREDYLSVLTRNRLQSDLPWTIPILLDASEEKIRSIAEGEDIALTSEDGRAIALMKVGEIYSYDKKEQARRVYGTEDPDHPGVAHTYAMKDRLLGGEIDLIAKTPTLLDQYAFTPSETRKIFEGRGWKTVAGFQTRNIPHLGHEYLQKTALTLVDGLFVNPVIGRKKKGDFRDELIIETYEVLISNYYPKDRVVMGLFKTEMRYAGPKEAIFHAIVRKNFGCTHFIVGRDHAGVGNYYHPFAAQKIFNDFPDLGIAPLFFPSFYYCTRCTGITNEKVCPHDQICRIDFSGTRMRKILTGKEERSPIELVRPEVSFVIGKAEKPFVE